MDEWIDENAVKSSKSLANMMENHPMADKKGVSGLGERKFGVKLKSMEAKEITTPRTPLATRCPPQLAIRCPTPG